MVREALAELYVLISPRFSKIDGLIMATVFDIRPSYG